jgi:predicted LPLAT superfamily acyltransferase
MARFEQYEVWELKQGRWEMAASFGDFEVANAVARERHYRVRLVRVTYEDGKKVQEEVLSEIGATRQNP